MIKQDDELRRIQYVVDGRVVAFGCFVAKILFTAPVDAMPASWREEVQSNVHSNPVALTAPAKPIQLPSHLPPVSSAMATNAPSTRVVHVSLVHSLESREAPQSCRGGAHVHTYTRTHVHTCKRTQHVVGVCVGIVYGG